MSDTSTPTPTPVAAAAPAKERVRCYCSRCRMRSLMGPVMVITVGFLFLIDQFVPGIRFGQLWPVFLIVVGVMLLLRQSASAEGHRG